MELNDFAQSANAKPPMRLGQRYDATRFLPDPGNTVVCHLNMDTAGGAAVVRARERMMELPGAERLLFTPKASLHMTVFEGVLDARRTPDAWPDFLDRNAPVAEVTEKMCARLADFDGPDRFEVRVEKVRVGGLELRGATEADARALRAWREGLSQAFGYRQTTHDAYRHHMTFAYPLDWLPDNLVPFWREAFTRIMTEMVEAAPVIPLHPPAFCRFNDMTHFEELVGLG